MRIVVLLVIFVLSIFAKEVIQEKEEFVLGKIYNQKVSRNAYFNQIGVPNVSVGTRCPKKGDCWSVIENQDGKVIRSFSSSDSVSAIAKGRYAQVAYLYYSYTYGSKKNRKTKYYLVDQKHKEYNIPQRSLFAYGPSLITKDRNIIQVGTNAIYKNGEVILKNETIDKATIGNNPQGDIAIAAILDASDEIIVTNLTQWISANVVLSKHGDRNGVISVYPKDKDNIYMAVYKNVNIYNKGLMGAHVNFKNKKVQQGWIFNSAQRNVGFDPDIYIKKNVFYLGTKDTTNRTDVDLVITPKEYATLGDEIPKHIKGFEKESIIDLLVGVGASQIYWTASSSIDDPAKDSKIVYGKVKYDISKSLYKSLYFEGRFDTVHLSVAYLQNEAKQIGGLAAKSSKMLNFLVDFDGLISDNSALRLKVLKGNINGVATYVENNNGGGSAITPGGETKEFSSELVTYGAYMMGERGMFAGLEYTNYTTPSAIGFSDSSKNIVVHGMDKNFKINYYSLVFGYDEISYAKRYEVNLSRWYMQGLGGIGWADYKLSSEAKKAVLNSNQGRGKKINYTGSLVLNGELELGYIFQQRYKAARGLGYSFTAGYRVRGAYTATGQDQKSDKTIKQNQLELEMSRYDIWHGPFATGNFIF